MRLRDIRNLLKENIDQVPASFEVIHPNSTAREFKNRPTVFRTVSNLARIPSLNSWVQQILKHPVFREDSSVLPNGPDGNLQNLTNRLHHQGTAILAFLNDYLDEDPEAYFSVKIPGSVRSPREVADWMNSIQLAFEQPVRHVFNKSLQVTLVEPGTITVELGFVAQAAGVAAGSFAGVMTFLGLLIRLGTEKARREIAEEEAKKAAQETLQSVEKTKQEQERTKQEVEKTRQAELTTEQLRLANDVKRAELRLAEHKLEIEYEVRLIPMTIPNIESTERANEISNLLKASIDEISKMTKRKGIFLLQLKAPEEVRKEFPQESLPETTNPDLLEARVKGLLTE